MASDSGRAVLTHPSPGPLKFLTAQEIQKSYADQLRAAQRINLSVDLVLAAKRHLGFLRNIDSLPCLHRGPAVLRAIRRSPYSPSKISTTWHACNGNRRMRDHCFFFVLQFGTSPIEAQMKNSHKNKNWSCSTRSRLRSDPGLRKKRKKRSDSLRPSCDTYPCRKWASHVLRVFLLLV